MKDRARQREIARMGGRKAHELGVGHKWTPEAAAAAGRKGGLKRAQLAAERRRAEFGDDAA